MGALRNPKSNEFLFWIDFANETNCYATDQKTERRIEKLSGIEIWKL